LTIIGLDDKLSFMSQRVVLIIIGVIILALMGAIFAVTYFSGRAARNKPTVTSNTIVNTPTTDFPEDGTPVAPEETPSPTDDPNFRSYSGSNYALKYPVSWGVLRCSNSNNYELDPYNSSDTTVACDYAVKPITVLTDVNAASCGGDTINLGGRSVVKSKTVKANGDVNYQWCFNGLAVSHRVSQSGSRATSKDDLSSQIEEMIASYSTGS
jgi:hypothetical protein